MDAKRRVALFSTNFLAASQTFIYNEIRSLQNTAVDVFSKKRMNEDRFPYDRVFSMLPTKSVKEFILGLVYEYFCYSKKFIRLFEENDYDLVHAQFGCGGIYAMFYSKRFHLPLVVTFCGYDVGMLQTGRRFLPQYWRYWLLSGTLFKRCTLILTVSQDLADRLESVGVPRDKIRVFHRGVSIPECKSYSEKKPGDPIRVIMAGRYVEKKGFEYGIEAVSMARKAGANIELEIVGKGELKEKCVALIEKLGIGEYVNLVEELKQSELFEHYYQSDVVMVPSVRARNGDVEGIPNVVKEGEARGLLALVTNHGGCPDTVDDGITGYIVPERDSRALADKLIEIAAHPDCLETMGRKGYEKMCAEFDISKTGENLESLYDEAIKVYQENSVNDEDPCIFGHLVDTLVRAGRAVTYQIADKMARGPLNWMPDEPYLKLMWRLLKWKKLDLDNPKTYGEKIQWIKLYDRNPEYCIMADKFAAKKWISDRIGEEFVVPNYGVWDHFRDIDFDQLPQSFVLKTTHDNGGVVIVRDKNTFDREAAEKFLEKHLKSTFYRRWREWCYEKVPPRILAEKLLEHPEDVPIIDYKLFCFNGEPAFWYSYIWGDHYKDALLTYYDGTQDFRKLEEGSGIETFYDMDCKIIPFAQKPHPALKEEVTRPEHYEEMVRIARELSTGIPHVRVDFFDMNGKLYVGELTFYTGGGMRDLNPDEYNLWMGNFIKLPEKGKASDE